MVTERKSLNPPTWAVVTFVLVVWLLLGWAAFG
jgi:hypothetical protein